SVKCVRLSGDPIPPAGETNSSRPENALTIQFAFKTIERRTMSLLRLYTRVLELLGKEARLGWILAGANLLLAAAQFAEPVLFGRIVDVLSGNPSTGMFASSSPWPLLLAWVAFGLFTIGCGAAVALHADRLAHRQRHAVLTGYFGQIMQLPLISHDGNHS